MAVWAPAAVAGPGYELDPVKPSIVTDAEVPLGIAVDQVTQNFYVAELSANTFVPAPGQIEQFDSSGVPTANSPFAIAGASNYFTGVAVNLVSHDVYAYQTQIQSPFGNFGAQRMDTFSSSGVPGATFVPTRSAAPQITTDLSGRIFYPNQIADTIQIFDSAGSLKDTIACTGCPGGGFDEPVSVALDALGNLYVADLRAGGRAIKFVPSGGSFVYGSVLQSGAGATAVAVDLSNNDVLVGDIGTDGYHIVAFDSSGNQFDDFGAEVLGPPSLGPSAAGQIAINATTHNVYVTDPSAASKVWIFNRIASVPAPTTSTTPATSLGQLEATLTGSVNPKGHGLSDCHFEYTDDADFQTNGFANADSIDCSAKPGGTSNTPVVARVEGLTPATSYRYRIAVESSGGSAEGADQSFTTLAALAPDVTVTTASSVTQTEAKIAGAVNPRGGPISDCHFEYTDDADFQTNGFANAISKECPFTPSGTDPEPVSVKITGLTAGTTYRFRLAATNNSGSDESTDESVTTLADTCATKPALCPPAEEPPKQQPTTPSTPVVTPPVTTPAPTPKKPLKCRKGFKKKKVHGKAKCVKKAKKKPKH